MEGEEIWNTFIIHMGPVRRQISDGSLKCTHVGQTQVPQEKKWGEKAWDGDRPTEVTTAGSPGP